MCVCIYIYIYIYVFPQRIILALKSLSGGHSFSDQTHRLGLSWWTAVALHNVSVILCQGLLGGTSTATSPRHKQIMAHPCWPRCRSFHSGIKRHRTAHGWACELPTGKTVLITTGIILQPNTERKANIDGGKLPQHIAPNNCHHCLWMFCYHRQQQRCNPIQQRWRPNSSANWRNTPSASSLRISKMRSAWVCCLRILAAETEAKGEHWRPGLPRPPTRQPAVLREATYRCLWKDTPVVGAFALQSSGRNCYPAPDLVLWRLIFPGVFFSGGVFFQRHR